MSFCTYLNLLSISTKKKKQQMLSLAYNVTQQRTAARVFGQKNIENLWWWQIERHQGGIEAIVSVINYKQSLLLVCLFYYFSTIAFQLLKNWSISLFFSLSIYFYFCVFHSCFLFLQSIGMIIIFLAQQANKQNEQTNWECGKPKQ